MKQFAIRSEKESRGGLSGQRGMNESAVARPSLPQTGRITVDTP